MTDPRIEAGVKLVPELTQRYEYHVNDLGQDYIETPFEAGKIKTIIAALEAAGEMVGKKPGWKLVPEEPTEAMMEEGRMEIETADGDTMYVYPGEAGRIYEAMLAAVPAAPASPDVEIVAQAICECQGRDWSKLFESSKDWWRTQARAAIAAIGRT